MRFTTLAFLLITAGGLTNAAPLESRQDNCPVTTTGDWTWKITKFTGRRPEGNYYSVLSFHITATNEGGWLDFNCSASAAWLQDDVFLTCGPNSGISFAFQSRYNGLIVRHGNTLNPKIGTATIPTVCRASGDGPNDQVCEGVADRYVSLVDLPNL
ncbi:uncharacterized protein ALTATR162_LOCUS3614 [Alternaria atra]|uniref:AA1-like domain-containing protein n=1 Tax=Alternaria atra TaxID=119953 RepID=A0A8J2N095_9PLEO|nr:uncharacterized protein ALTATR162_LOCUS3614 [Alternaria atra]CAG5155342.1 unnamed protein product [Alternaria atra]